MFNCTNLPNVLNNTYVLGTCEAANAANTFVTVKAGELSSHMVSQYGTFQKFVSSDSSAVKTSGAYQRVLPASLALLSAHTTLKSACATTDAFLSGKFTKGLIFGAITAAKAALTCYSASMALDPVQHVNFFHS